MPWGNHLVSMLLLRLSAQDLLTLDSRDRMVPHLAARWRYFRGADASESERSAWAESLVSLAIDLVAAGRGNVEMIVECAATLDEAVCPGDPRLIDVVLVGRHPERHVPSVQLVELKRWSTVSRVELATADLLHVPGIEEKKKHPALQLGANYEAFTSPQGPFQGTDFECGGFAYLHNATDESVRTLIDVDAPTGAYARVYTSDRREQLLSDLRMNFAEVGAASTAERMLQSMGLRNTPLLDAMIWSRGADTVFTLRGRQKEVADQVLETASRVLPDPRHPALVPDERRVVFLVTGGAGTGKSAIGLQIKAELEAQGRTVKYASGSRAFNGALQEHVGYGDRQFRETFTYFSSFVTPPDPLLDVLICDEAHRLRDRSTSRFWKPEEQGTGPQVDELLAASRLTVFFLDEGQSVRPNEVGTVDLIKDAAERHNALVIPYKLREQFRCGGSDAYVRWAKALLGVTDEEPGKWRPDGLMHIEVADTPEELEQIIRTEVRAGASGRMVAGYCWPWTKPLGKERRLEADVRIGEWHRPWNADSESFCENEAPPSRIWSVHENGLGQIGCVYTAQGLEWDWCGVLMGDDMVRRGDRWVFRRGKELKTADPGIKRVAEPGSFDPKVKAGSVDDDEFARLVRHAYHVLMTRASRATVLYSTDQETRDYLKSLVGKVEIHGLRPTWENLPVEARTPHLPRPGRGRGRGRNKGKSRKSGGSQASEMRLF
ncbi:ATPase AAA [Streptomyces rubiginosohelvolus]|uniref:ATPase AAA n=2 Tax=Streptomyces rubiginosohelvolus TaxID=67362 RepID=A0ABQ3BMK7_9ACTN|nr:ATPase AAA [Streptomyces rubiginosohelvolus]GGZ47106.1 ATPase AAA [Streptomyces pluricolorescens]